MSVEGEQDDDEISSVWLQTPPLQVEAGTVAEPQLLNPESP